ncbi:MAG: MlaD family protein [Bacteroidales bacterium]
MAKFKINREQKLALFTIIILISIYGVINFLKGKELFSRQTYLHTSLYEVDGLAPTTPVYLRGLKIGAIGSIDWNKEEDNFLVTLAIKSRYKIPSNSIAYSYGTDLLGSRALKLELGDSPLFLKNRDTIPSAFEAGMIEGVIGSLTPVIEKIDTLLASLHTTVERVNSIVGEEVEESLKKSLENLEQTLHNSTLFTKDLQESGNSISQIIENINKLTTRLEGENSPLNRSLENIEAITEQIKVADLTKTIEEIRGLAAKFENPDGSIGKLLQSDSLHNSLESLIKELNHLIEEITKNPKKYIKITVF